jgi:hypothetical protein
MKFTRGDPPKPQKGLGSVLGEDGKGQVERLKVEAGAANQ